ncbi:MAG: DUF3883 domain-containing protein [Chthoniobacterales bacterium]
MVSVDISPRNSNHIIRIIYDLVAAGWVPASFPANRQISRNLQLIELRVPRGSLRFRISGYKVSGRGEEHRSHQQRIEITNTVAGGLARKRKWTDIILGYDDATDAYVGLDPRRITLGGETHNASTSVDPISLAAATTDAVLIRPHRTRSFGLEYQAIYRPARLSEYLFNHELIHEGQYRGDGLFSGRVRRRAVSQRLTLGDDCCEGDHFVFVHTTDSRAKPRKVRKAFVEAIENEEEKKIRDVTPEELELLLKKRREVGDAGESFVYQHEQRRLKKAGKNELASNVNWVSRKAIGRGYDIKSYEIDGSDRFIEVKATIGNGQTFFMSGTEWGTAEKQRETYWIYRVINTLEKPSISHMICDPVAAEADKHVERVADGWRVTIL